MVKGMAYINDIITGLLVFPLIAALFTLPYAVYQYNRRGSVSKYRTCIIYSFILYMLIAFFLISLPLPDWASIAGNTWQDHINLIPFRQIYLYWHDKVINPASLMTYLVSMLFWQLLFNILLTVPFGVYMRYYFKLSLKRTVFFSFLLSLFYETSQITGLFGIFSEPYRMADIEDLICNTLGGVVGWQIAYVFTKVLPGRDENNATFRIAGTRIAGMRRFWAALFDYACSMAIYIFVLGVLRILIPDFTRYSIYGQIYNLAFFCASSLVQVLLTKGSTLGHAICRLILVTEEGDIASTEQLVKRYLYLWLFTALPQSIVGWFTHGQFIVFNNDFKYLALIAVSRLYFIWYIFNVVFRKGALMPHDKLSGTLYMAIGAPEKTKQ